MIEFPNGKLYEGVANDCPSFMGGEMPQLIVTSPPYWGKRKYPGGETWWGGSADCDHKKGKPTAPPRNRSEDDHRANTRHRARSYNADGGYECNKCGAWHGQLGHENTPGQYANNLAGLLTALPLAEDGLLFVNIGETYIAEPKAEGNLKKKDLAGVPYRFAFAMQERGWHWRDNIIWSKTNFMPCSVRDRCGWRYENILMFSKNPHYYFNRMGVAVPVKAETVSRFRRGNVGEMGDYVKNKSNPARRRKPTIDKYKEDGEKHRKMYNVWSFSTASHSSDLGVHLAPMPLELARRCILLGSREGDLVFDPFIGTGTTAEAAEKTGRRWVGCDSDPQSAAFISERVAKTKRIL